jgi:hypothetical protein
LLLTRELVEALCGLGGVLVSGWWIPLSWRPLIFCAFFLLVFAVAVRYRTFVAYSTAVGAALAYGLLLRLHPAPQSTFLSLALEAFVLLLTGIGTSDILRWQRLRLLALEQTHACTHQALQEVQEQYRQLEQARDALQRQIREMPVSLVTLSEQLAQWWLLTGSQHFSALVDVLVSVLEVRSCACYMQEGNILRLCAEHMIGDSAHAPVLDTDDPLIKRVLDRRQVSTVCDRVGPGEVAAGVAVMAGPLLNPAGELVGLVVIDCMPLLNLTCGTARLFGALLQIFACSLHASETGAGEVPALLLRGSGNS